MNKYDSEIKRKVGKLASSVALTATLAVTAPTIANAEELTSEDINTTSTMEQVNSAKIEGVF